MDFLPQIFSFRSRLRVMYGTVRQTDSSHQCIMPSPQEEDIHLETDTEEAVKGPSILFSEFEAAHS